MPPVLPSPPPHSIAFAQKYVKIYCRCYLAVIYLKFVQLNGMTRTFGKGWRQMGHEGGGAGGEQPAHNLNGKHFLDQGIYEIQQNQNYDYDFRCCCCC